MYDYKAQKKYNEKIKKLACNVFVDEFEMIEKHYKNKGFSSANSYLKYLLKNDMKKTDTSNSDNENKEKLFSLIDRLSDEDFEKVIDYVRLLLK